MKKCILFLFISFPCFSQTIKHDTLLIRKGNKMELIITNTSNKSKQIIRKVDDKLHGFQEKYSSNGKLLEKAAYKKGYQNGTTLTYNYDGNLSSSKNYAFSKTKNKSVLEGKTIMYNYQNQKVYNITTYKDDQKDGAFIAYHTNGKIAEKSNYKQNLLTGKQEVYYDNGHLRWIAFYEIIDENGTPKSVKSGNQLYYNSDGKLLTDFNFKRDKKDGICKEYNPKTFLLQTEINYKQDKVHGLLVKYYENGNLNLKTTYYSEIEINGKVVSNIYDGKREEYHTNGKLNFSQNYVMGKREGVLEKFNQDGILIEKGFYKNDLLIDKHETFDDKGNKTLEENYSLIKENEVLKSVKIGYELMWKNNILVSKKFFENGLEEGTSETFFDSGKISSSVQKRKGVQNGFKIEYYENGNVKEKTNYVQISPKNWQSYYKQIGWSYNYDDGGNLTYQRFQEEYEKEIYALFKDNKNKKYQINKTLSFSYFPNGDIMSFSFLNEYNQVIFANYYYQNQSIRKLVYQEPSFLNDFHLVFSNNDTFQHSFLNYDVYKDNSNQPYYLDINDNIVKGTNQKPVLDKIYTQSIDKNWTKSNLFSDTQRNGKYVLYYTNSKPFLEINFEDNLPHGTFVVFEPTRSDTLVYKKFSHGVQVGDFLEKFAGRIVLQKGKYYNNGKLAEISSYLKNGKPYAKKYYNEEGNVIKNISFHDNGNIEEIQNYLENTFTYFDENGHVTQERIKLEGNKSVHRKFHKNSAIIQSEAFYLNEEREGVYSQYFEDGKLQLKYVYQNNKRNGPFVEYHQDGNIKKQGTYVDDEMDGAWIINDGKTVKNQFYKSGKLEVVPSLKKCECTDTSIPSNKIRFVPRLKDLVEYEKLLNSIPDYIIPIDSLNFNKIFFSGLQTSSGNNSGFASMKLLMFKPFSFFIPANKQIKITLNPCITEGYISNMDVTSNYSYDSNRGSTTTIDAKRIAIELVESPLQSNDSDYENFTCFFDIQTLHFDTKEKLNIELIANGNSCYTAAKIKDYLFLEVTNAHPIIFNQPGGFDIYNTNLTNEERENFFGLDIQEAKAIFKFLNNDTEIDIQASVENVYASGNYVSGNIRISCQKTAEDEFVLLDANKSKFSAQNLKKEWIKNGFSRLKTYYNNETQQLFVEFFVEK